MLAYEQTCCATISSRSNRTTPSRSESAWSSEPAPSLLVLVIIVVMIRKARRNEKLAAAQSGALRESELRFRRIFEESPLGILLAEPDSQRIVQANPAFCRMLGTDAEQIVGNTIVDLTHVDDREMLRDAIGPGPSGRRLEARYVTQSGAIAWASVRLTQLSASDRPAGTAARPHRGHHA